ncbi:TRAP transporter large permease [Anaeroselena agilis]|uniref:TRAP transporter large permease n=1 Tax=Anaeroselena agilis TaxID=3063788 RepID=A0ABU3P1L6_9FIRM|nr:TRAP transporter large permease [Selenomonadales bacterium 4137-cl]
MATTIFLSFFLLLFCRVPVSFSLALSSVLALVLNTSMDTAVIIQRMYTASESFSLVAVPFFILAGGLMENGGISRRLVKFATDLVGHIRGGLAMVSVVASMFFAGVSGSTAADTAAVGSILIPAMERRKYGKDMATSVVACAGAIGIIIPPSIPMVILGVTAGISIGGLFLGGFIPGLLVGFALMFTSYLFAKKRDLPAEACSTGGEMWQSFKDSILAIMTAVIILGGILSGVFTATEASVVAAVYAFIVGFFIYKELKLADLPRILAQSGVTTGVVVLCVATASAFGWILAAERIPALLAEFVFSISTNPFVVLLLVNALMLFMGMILDVAPIIIILIPIVFPIVLKLGIDPIHFGVMTIVNMAIGQCTPPVGVALFVATGISKISLGSMLNTYYRFIGAMILVLVLITLVPDLITFIPRLVMGGKL